MDKAPIVVGVDGSDESLAAVALAVRMAAARRSPVRLVHGLVVPLPYLAPTPMSLGVPPVPPTSDVAETVLREEAEKMLANAGRYAQDRGADLDVSCEVVMGGPAGVLVDESRRAAAVVVGDRGVGGFVGLLTGSVAIQVAGHAHSPVVVAHLGASDTGPVLVGVDGSPTSAQAIGFAAAEANLRGTHVVALHAWTPPVGASMLGYDLERLEAEQASVLAESVAGLGDQHRGVRVEQRLVRGPVAKTLIDESKHAQLLVIGSRGRGGFTGLLLGSISQAMIHHAECPVAVIRADATPQ